MIKNILVNSIMAMALTMIAGCATNDNYCCTSNDQCVPVHGKSTECTMDACGKCKEVDQPVKVDAVSWQDATVGEYYKVELTASGGIPPYSWSLAKLNDNENKLGWLVLIEDDSDNTKAWLQNDTSNGTTQYPSKPTTDSDALTITVTVKDNTRHGTDVKGVDNSIAIFNHENKDNRLHA